VQNGSDECGTIKKKTLNGYIIPVNEGLDYFHSYFWTIERNGKDERENERRKLKNEIKRVSFELNHSSS
jgi:transcriptional regulator of heat shock response